MEEKTIQGQINKLKENKVTKQQSKLIKFIESNSYENIIYLSITEIALAAKVSEATVLRFCRSLGFSGFQDFKLYLAQEVGNSKTQIDKNDYIHNICESYITTLEKCKSNISVESVEKAVDLIRSSRVICCFGVGNSYAPAMELHNRLFKLGIYSQCERDLHLQYIGLSSCGENDVLIIFSVSGGTKDIVELAQFARENGVKIIIVTNYEKSPLAKYADIILASGPSENPVEAGSLTSKVVQLYFVDIIFTGIYFKDKSYYDENIAKSNASVVKKLV